MSCCIRSGPMRAGRSHKFAEESWLLETCHAAFYPRFCWRLCYSEPEETYRRTLDLPDCTQVLGSGGDSAGISAVQDTFQEDDIDCSSGFAGCMFISVSGRPSKPISFYAQCRRARKCPSKTTISLEFRPSIFHPCGHTMPHSASFRKARHLQPHQPSVARGVP